LSGSAQVLPDPIGRQEFMKRGALTDLFYPDVRVRALCERQGIPVLGFSSGTARAMPSGIEFFDTASAVSKEAAIGTTWVIESPAR